MPWKFISVRTDLAYANLFATLFAQNGFRTTLLCSISVSQQFWCLEENTLSWCRSFALFAECLWGQTSAVTLWRFSTKSNLDDVLHAKLKRLDMYRYVVCVLQPQSNNQCMNIHNDISILCYVIFREVRKAVWKIEGWWMVIVKKSFRL